MKRIEQVFMLAAMLIIVTHAVGYGQQSGSAR